jgi:hypothetical protein
VIGSVDKVYADCDRMLQDSNRLPLIGRIELALKRRTAVADGGYF